MIISIEAEDTLNYFFVGANAFKPIEANTVHDYD